MNIIVITLGLMLFMSTPLFSAPIPDLTHYFLSQNVFPILPLK